MLETLLTIYFWILPFQWALQPTAGIDLPVIRALSVLVFAGWFIRGLATRRVDVPRPLALIPLVSFLVLVTASIGWAGNGDWALRKVLFLWSFLPLFLVLSSALRNQETRLQLRGALVWSAAAAAFVGIVQFFAQFVFGLNPVSGFWTGHLDPLFLGQNLGGAVATYSSSFVNIAGRTLLRATAVFPDPHMFSFYLGMSLPLAIGYATSEVRRRKVWVWLPTWLILGADLLTFSRGGYVGLIAGGLVGGVIFGLSSRLRGRYLLSVIGAGVVMIGAIGFSPVGTRLLSSFSRTDGSNIERWRLWSEAGTHIPEHPFFGTGLGNYPLAVKPSAAYREPIYAHNLYLDIAVETGLTGLGLFLAWVVSALVRLFLAWERKRDTLALAAFLSLTVYAAHALFDTPLYSVQNLPLLVFLVSLGEAL